MRIQIILLLLLALQVCQLNAQKVDSLKSELALTENPTDQIEILNQIGATLLVDKHQEAIPYFEQIVEIGKKIDDKQSIASALNDIGIAWYRQNNLQKSSQFYFKALEFTDTSPAFYKSRLHSFNNLGWNFKRLNQPEKALEYFKQAEVYARMEEYNYSLGSVLNNLGVVQKDLGMYEASLATLSESLALNEKSNNTGKVRYNLNNMGVVLYKLKQYEEAIEILDKVLEMNIAATDTVEIINNYINLGLAYHQLNRVEQAENYLLSALQLKSHLLPENRGEIYLELDAVYSKLGDFETARAYLDKYILLTDSIQELNFQENIFDLEAKYNSLLKDKNLEEAQAELAEQRFYLALFISGFIIVLVSAILIWLNYWQKKKSETKLKTLYDKLETQSQKLIESNKQINEINTNLESIIQQRTSIIESQNQRLISYAYMNSHKIRGPVATLLGLVTLLEDDQNIDIQAGLIKNSKDTIRKLDAIIHDVNSQLQNEGIEQGRAK